jgi:hypothetical protein
MAAIVLLLVLAAFLWASWVLMGNVAKMPARWQRRSAAVLVFLVVLEIIQWLTGYAVALPMASLFTVLFGIIAYVLLVFFVLHKRPLAGVIGLVLPMFFIFRPNRGLLIALILVLSMGGFVPQRSGWISPTISYDEVQSRGLIGSGTLQHYRIYRSPRFFPMIRKRVSLGLMPCPEAAFSRGPNPSSILITCNNSLGPASTTVALPR